MKQALFFIVLFGLSQAANFRITSEKGLAVKQSMPWRESEVITNLDKGDVREIVDTFADYYEVEVISGKVLDISTKSTNLGIKGVMWVGCWTNHAGAQAIVGGKDAPQGASLLNENPRSGFDDAKPASIKAYVWPGSVVRVIKPFSTWYKIAPKPTDGWKTGWVCAAYGKVE